MPLKVPELDLGLSSIYDLAETPDLVPAPRLTGEVC